MTDEIKWCTHGVPGVGMCIECMDEQKANSKPPTDTSSAGSAGSTANRPTPFFGRTDYNSCLFLMTDDRDELGESVKVRTYLSERSGKRLLGELAELL